MKISKNDLKKMEGIAEKYYESNNLESSGVLPFEKIIKIFQERFVEYIAQNHFEMNISYDSAAVSDTIKTSTDYISSDAFLDMELEELFNVLIDDGGSEVVTLIMSNASGSVESLVRDIDSNESELWGSARFKRIDSVPRDLFLSSYENKNEPINVDPIPELPNGFPHAINILAGPSQDFAAFEIALKEQSFAELTGNIFSEGASAGADGLGSINLDFVRPGSTKVVNSDSIVVTTPEGNTLTLYTTNITALGIKVGDYVYTLNNAVPHLPGLGADVFDDPQTGEQIFVDAFRYTITDSNGDTSTAFLFAHIADGTPIAQADINHVDETLLFVNGSESVTGNLLSNDELGPDGGSVIAVNGIVDGGVGDLDGMVNGAILTQTDYDTGNGMVTGRLWVTLATGNYTFTLIDATDVPDSQLQTLHISEYTIRDADHDLSTANLTIVIELNQAPVAADDTMTTDEDSIIVFSEPGVLLNDLDEPNDVLIVSDIDATNTIGVVEFSSNGEITYDPNGKFNYLAQGEEATDTFTYTIEDAEGLTSTATVTVIITGINDAPTLTGDTGIVGEDGTLVATGNIEFSDIDTSDVNTLSVTSADGLNNTQSIEDNADGSPNDATVSVVVAGLYGSLSLFGDGSWEYTLDNNHIAVQSLSEGESLIENFAVSYSDDFESATDSIRVTIHGTNDTPTLSGDTGIVVEDDILVATGNIEFSDIDTSDVNTLSVTSADGLNNTQSIEDNADGSPNDATVSVVVAGLYGSLSLLGDGSWEYTLDNNHIAVQSLGEGESLIENFAVSYSDDFESATDSIRVTIHGTNDTPTLSGDTGIVVEDDILVATGNIEFSDIDTSDVNRLSVTSADGLNNTQSIEDNADGSPNDATVSVVVAGLYGSLSLFGDGSWEYTLDNNHIAVQSLSEGESLTENFAVSYSDDFESATDSIIVTIHGTNDTPTLSGDTGIVVEDDILVVGGNIEFSDIDASDVNILSVTSADGLNNTQSIEDNADGSPNDATASVVVAGLYGSLSLLGDGSWEYTLDNNHVVVQFLGNGESLIENFAVSYSDDFESATGSIVVTIHGTNDVPTLTGDTGTAVKDNTLVVAGNLEFSDIDTSDVNILSVTSADGLNNTQSIEDNADGSPNDATVSVVVAGLYGSLSLLGDGSWEYTLDNNHIAVQSLGEGESLTENFAVSYSDDFESATGSIMVTIDGVNDNDLGNEVQEAVRSRAVISEQNEQASIVGVEENTISSENGLVIQNQEVEVQQTGSDDNIGYDDVLTDAMDRILTDTFTAADGDDRISNVAESRIHIDQHIDPILELNSLEEPLDFNDIIESEHQSIDPFFKNEETSSPSLPVSYTDISADTYYNLPVQDTSMTHLFEQSAPSDSNPFGH